LQVTAVLVFDAQQSVLLMQSGFSGLAQPHPQEPFQERVDNETTANFHLTRA
jgi:hypothetical protein